MTTSKLDDSGVFEKAGGGSSETHFLLSTHEVAVRRNGIEFLSHRPIPLWKEVTVQLQSPWDHRSLEGVGVVVDCTGNRHTGYVVSLMFVHLPPGSEQRLDAWSRQSTL